MQEFLLFFQQHPYYVVYRNGEPMGAIDSPDDLDIFAAANHYTA